MEDKKNELNDETLENVTGGKIQSWGDLTEDGNDEDDGNSCGDPFYNLLKPIQLD